MKRGLVKLDPEAAVSAAFEARLGALRTNLRAKGASVGLIYGDVSRSGGMDYLTNFCLYWNEAVLAVPAAGSPALVTKLSKRVQPWIGRTSVLDDIRTGPRVAENVAALVEERLGTRVTRIALHDLDWWPNSLVANLRAAMPEAELVDWPGAVRALRQVPDQEEIRVLHEAHRRLERAVLAAERRGGTVAERTGIAVREARLAGLLDAEIACRRLSDGTAFIDAIGQYRYAWVRLCRPRGGTFAATLRDALAAALDRVRAGVSEAEVESSVRGVFDARYRHRVACMSHADIETRGVVRGPEDHDRPFREGEILAVVVTAACDDETAVAAETVFVRRNGTEPLGAAAARLGIL